MELRWVFFLVESRHHHFGFNQHLGGVFPIWDEFISVMKGLLRFSSLNCSQASWEKAPERTKPSTPSFCLKEISVTSNQKKKRSLWKVGFFLGGERCFTKGHHPKIGKNACWDHGSSREKRGDESRENPPRLDAQGSDFRIKVPCVFTNEKVTWANTNQSSIYYLFQGCFPLLYLCSLITHPVFVFDADFKSSNVASDFFLNICLKQISQKIVGFFW